MADARPDDHDRAGALSHDLPCTHCGHTAHPREGCNHCPCEWN